MILSRHSFDGRWVWDIYNENFRDTRNVSRLLYYKNGMIVSHNFSLFSDDHNYFRGNTHDVVANVLHSDIVVSEFELQSRYYIHFGTNNLWKGMP